MTKIRLLETMQLSKEASEKAWYKNNSIFHFLSNEALINWPYQLLIF